MSKLKPNGHTTQYFGGKKTKDSVQATVAYLKERYKKEQALKREGRLLLAMTYAERQQNRNETVPLRKPIVTKVNTFNTTLRACPGGARDEARTGSYAAMLKQIAHPETGTIAIEAETKKGAALLQRLQRSAQNCNTTQGSYY